MSKTSVKNENLQENECDSILEFLFKEQNSSDKEVDEYVDKYLESQEKWRLVFESIQEIDISLSINNYIYELLDNIKHVLPDLKIVIVIYEKSIGKNNVFSRENEENIKYLLDSVFSSLNMYNAHLEVSKYFESINHATNYRIFKLESSEAELGYVYFESNRKYSASDIGYLENLCRHIISAMETIGLYEGIKKENDKKLEYAASFSHEIKTPLNGIIGYAELLKKNSDKLGEELKEYVENICIGSHQLKGLLMDIIENAKLKYGEIVVRKQNFDTKVAVENVLKIFSSAIKEKNITIKTTLMQAGITSDYTKFNQILYNLVSNAIKFSFPKSIIEVTSWIQEDKYYFEIKNEGEEIKQYDADNIFNFLHKTGGDFETNSEGSGIGLCVSKRLSEVLCGILEFKSDKEHTTFTLTLPV